MYVRPAFLYRRFDKYKIEIFDFLWTPGTYSVVSQGANETLVGTVKARTWCWSSTCAIHAAHALYKRHYVPPISYY